MRRKEYFNYANDENNNDFIILISLFFRYLLNKLNYINFFLFAFLHFQVFN